MNSFLSLESKLNKTMDEEIQRGYAVMDSDIVLECSDMLLRMDTPERYVLTKNEYNNSITALIGKERGKIKISRKKLIAILVAAILLLVLAISATAYSLKKHEIISFDGFSQIIFEKQNQKNSAGDILIGYIPDGFVQTENRNQKIYVVCEYENGNDYFIAVKDTIFGKIYVDNEHGDLFTEKKNGIEYIISGNEDKSVSIFWLHNGICYSVSGNIGKDELLKIAESIR